MNRNYLTKLIVSSTMLALIVLTAAITLPQAFGDVETELGFAPTETPGYLPTPAQDELVVQTTPSPEPTPIASSDTITQGQAPSAPEIAQSPAAGGEVSEQTFGSGDQGPGGGLGQSTGNSTGAGNQLGQAPAQPPEQPKDNDEVVHEQGLEPGGAWSQWWSNFIASFPNLGVLFQFAIFSWFALIIGMVIQFFNTILSLLWNTNLFNIFFQLASQIVSWLQSLFQTILNLLGW